MNRSQRAAIAEETLQILESGKYTLPDDPHMEINIKSEIRQAIDETIVYAPDDFDRLYADTEKALQNQAFHLKFEVANATTFAMARNILNQSPGARVFCLNFASAKNPGGGFLGGSQAQEEALARASALYACINPQQKYYKTNRAFKSCFYTDHMIYSPRVPVFRDDLDQLLSKPYRVSILTAPAVNIGAVANSEPERLHEVESVMLNRIEKLLSIAVIQGYRHVVLGAWGCGVFRNDPSDMAKWFYKHLGEGGRFQNAFEGAHFGVLDFTKDGSTFRPFADQFCVGA